MRGVRRENREQVERYDEGKRKGRVGVGVDWQLERRIDAMTVS